MHIYQIIELPLVLLFDELAKDVSLGNYAVSHGSAFGVLYASLSAVVIAFGLPGLVRYAQLARYEKAPNQPTKS